MGTLVFIAPGFSAQVIVPTDAPRGTLLAIARAHGIPILFNCEAGGCGACIVRVQHVGPGEPAPLSSEETFFLGAMGKLAPAGLEKPEAVAIESRFRLACQYVPGDETLIVDFTNEMGGV